MGTGSVACNQITCASAFNSNAQELVPMVYCCVKPRVQMFYFLIKQNKTDFTIIHLNISGF